MLSCRARDCDCKGSHGRERYQLKYTNSTEAAIVDKATNRMSNTSENEWKKKL